MATLKSVSSIATSIKPPIKISRKRLRKYSWLPDVLRIKGSILVRIAGPVLTVTIFASIVATAYHYGYNVTLTNSVTPLLAVVVGLILVFRNTTSYDRYYEGRKDFGSMMSNIRNLSRLIWINVNLPTANTNLSSISSSPNQGASIIRQGALEDEKKMITPESLKLQKTRALNLLLAYALAVKHHLRGEEGLDWPDYSGVLPPNFARLVEAGFDRTMDGSYSSIDSDAIGGSRKQKLGGKVKSPDSQTLVPDSSTPLLTDSHRAIQIDSGSESQLPLPMVIAHEITRMLYKFKRLGYLDVIGPAGTNAMMALCSNLSDQLTAMERVATTPIPSPYGIHLKQCVTLYLFALPFTLVKELGWRMIPVVTVVAITLMGIEGIADEIEMPFGYDMCDLPLDRYCAELKNEVEYIVARLPQGIEGEDLLAD